MATAEVKRTLAGEALRDKENIYKFLLDNTKEIILILSKRGKILFANKAIINNFGYSEEEIVGKSITNFLTKDSIRKSLYALAQEFLGNPQPEMEVRAKTKSGEIIYLKVARGSTPIYEKGKLMGMMVCASDITALRETEKELQEREKRFRELWDNAPVAYHTLDIRGNITDVNQPEVRMLGYTKEEMLGKSIFEFILPEQRAEAQKRFKQKIFGQSIPKAESRIYVKKDGSRIYVDIDDVLERDKKGKVVGIRTTMADVTEHKQAELLRDAVYRISQATDKAANLSDLYKSVHEIISTVMPAKNFYIAIYDPSSELLSFPYYCDEYDEMPAPQKLGKGLTEYVLRTAKPLLCGKATDKELRRRGDIELVGTPSAIWLGVPLIVGDEAIGVMIVQDYSDPKTYGDRELRMLEYVSSQVAKAIEKKRAEEALRESEARYRTLVETSPYAITLTDLQCNILICNQQSAAMHGLRNREETIGTNAFDWIAPEDRARAAENARKTIESGSVRNVEYSMLRADGSSFPTELSASVIKDAEGNRQAFIAITRDITQRKKAEKELIQTLEMLRKNLAATIQAISRMVEIRDPNTAGHQRRVADLARDIAKEMGLSQEQVDAIRMAGLIHDIGKISVPAEILSKPGRLGESEFNMLKIHPKYAYEILKSVEFPGPVAQTILQHHERIDGSGYPSGLKDKEILVEAKILAVADVVEAMTSHRPYRPAHGLEQALEEISKNRGVLYDPKVTEACLSLFVEKGFSFREE